ncbi:ProQ/FinO family protein [Salmonella enterica subsp. diarizonae serovar 16:z10:e,n,x,z15]|uniref:ProQ/FINO family protein n=1 Tax=Salmonella enterica TaxID=28901 RepID=UPI001F0E43BE|nr:ProQ/FinO family protein [Salmonella enterica subsp. diarizonae serovar 16:z10:e,n,x,z15]MCH5491710.1 ProQ/FinO family protein [Salmonella enterica subsp. diarizonae serovar 16:z10:e,n,x,z15]MCH5502134.1 ProQ/FinO family protein [Salmonella enterica subsp. diarizonae serovar 16:z10:e,n,x,z15]
MTTANTSRKPAHPQGSAWQETLQDYKDQMTKQQQTQQDAPESDNSISAHKVKSTSRKAPQKPTSEPQQAKQQPAQERVRPEGMNRRQWKNFKHMRRVLAFWPELFNLDNPKPLKVGVLNDLMQDISARNLTIGAGVLKAAIASYTRRIRYQKALAAGGARYDLNGQPCGEITPEQQQEAADALKKAKDKPEAESATDGR